MSLVHCSVIIPLFNKAPYVEDAIRSVLAQSYPHFELLVVDDGSTDGGAEFVRRVSDERVRLIVQPNQGVSVARNTGIAQANGELIAFLDADDCYGRGFLQRMVDLAVMFPECDYFATSFVVFRDSEPLHVEPPEGVVDIEAIGDLFAVLRTRGNVFYTGSVAFRRRLFAGLSEWFPPNEQEGEDQDLFFRVAERSALAFDRTPHTAYRSAVAGSLSAGTQLEGTLSDRAGRRHTVPPYLLRLEQRARTPNFPRILRSSALRLVTERRVTFARNALIDGKRRMALTHLLRMRGALASRRWWVTLPFALLLPGAAMRWWEYWRYAGSAKSREGSRKVGLP